MYHIQNENTFKNNIFYMNSKDYCYQYHVDIFNTGEEEISLKYVLFMHLHNWWEPKKKKKWHQFKVSACLPIFYIVQINYNNTQGNTYMYSVISKFIILQILLDNWILWLMR